ncbi:MAG: hypothetical protein KF768_00160 [Phycisphaeraceae bacterium]|nr:hypothetical protein [Phycisphaeraceae bacterium]
MPAPHVKPTRAIDPAPPAPLMWVLLRHDTPDGLWHLDWLLERPGLTLAERNDPNHRSLLCWRLPRDVDGVEHGGGWRPTTTGSDRKPIRAEQLPDHRRLYLTYEGQLSGDRGRVRRLASGLVEFDRLAPDATTFRVRGAAGSEAESVTWFGERQSSDANWLLRQA